MQLKRGDRHTSGSRREEDVGGGFTVADVRLKCIPVTSALKEVLPRLVPWLELSLQAPLYNADRNALEGENISSEAVPAI